jgi:hypothetical protein
MAQSIRRLLDRPIINSHHIVNHKIGIACPPAITTDEDNRA